VWRLLSRALAAWRAAVEWTAMKRTRLAACRRRLEAAASQRALLSWHCSAKAAAQVLATDAAMRIKLGWGRRRCMSDPMVAAQLPDTALSDGRRSEAMMLSTAM